MICNRLIEFIKVGYGWCRPDECIANDPDCALRVNGFHKDDSNSTECKLVCSNEPSCLGYAIASPSHGVVPNRCYVYGKIPSTFNQTLSEWESYPNDYFRNGISK